MRRIVLVGMGWLGAPLGVALMAKGYRVTGTTRSTDKATRLASSGAEVVVWQAEQGPLPLSLQGAELVITLPPSAVDDYPLRVEQLVQQAHRQGSRRVLLVSSTGVYGQQDEGLESVAPQPDSPRGACLLAAEQRLASGGVPWLIVRPAGLIGPGRHPARFLSGKVTSGGGAPVNLVHQEDVIRFITALLEQGQQNAIFNLCSPDHPTRRQFYVAACERQGLPLPVFADDVAQGKQIAGQHIVKVTGCAYHVSDLMQWLESVTE